MMRILSLSESNRGSIWRQIPPKIFRRVEPLGIFYKKNNEKNAFCPLEMDLPSMQHLLKQSQEEKG